MPTYGPLSLFVRDSLPTTSPSPSSQLGGSGSVTVILLVIFSVLIAFLVVFGLFWRQMKNHNMAMRELEKAERLSNRAIKPKIWEVWAAPREPHHVQTKWENMRPLWVQGSSSVSSLMHTGAHVRNEMVTARERQGRRWFTNPWSRTDRTAFQTMQPTATPQQPHPLEPNVEVAMLIVMPSPVCIDKNSHNSDTQVLDKEKEGREELGEHMIGITYMSYRHTDNLKTTTISA